MFYKNDGRGDNAVQNRFTALLKKALHNRKLDYIKSFNKKAARDLPLDDYTYLAGVEYDFLKAIIDYDIIRNVLKCLTERERKILVLHIIGDKDFAEIGRMFGLTYKGTATIFYKVLSKLREKLGSYENEI